MKHVMDVIGFSNAALVPVCLVFDFVTSSTVWDSGLSSLVFNFLFSFCDNSRSFL